MAARSSRIGGLLPIPRSALGTIGEDRTLELLVVLGKGGFVCYVPRSDFEGIDLIVKRRWRAGALPIQVKTRAYHDKAGNLTVAVDDEDLPEEDPKLIVVLEYFESRAQLGLFLWVIPDNVYRAQSKLTHAKYEATLSPKRNARDQWVDYRYNVGDLPWVVGHYLDALGPRPLSLPSYSRASLMGLRKRG